MNEISAVICETNPCHNGHAALFQRAKTVCGENGVLIAVMSGNFVQRGLPAVWDKYRRAALLIEQGVDLVVELPYPWSAAGGEDFARAGVSIADRLGAARLVFGSEQGDTDTLLQLAKMLHTPEADKKRAACLSDNPALGAAVLEDRLCADLGIAPLSANDKLGLWYIDALRETDCQPIAVPRLPGSERIASAGRLREWLYGGETEPVRSFVPDPVWQTVRAEPVTPLAKYYDLLHTYFRFFVPDTAPELRETSGGVYERLCRSAYRTASGTAFFEAAACKKYTNARLRRAALFCATAVTDALLAEMPRYTLLLAANEKGCAWLGRRKKSMELSIVTKPADFQKLPGRTQAQLAILHRADAFYAYLMGRDGGYFLRTSPYIAHRYSAADSETGV